MASNDWLNDVMQFDHVIRINPDLSLDEHPTPHVYAPESVISVDDNGQILADDEKAFTEYLRSQGWEVLNGYSGQSGYAGPIMHASEYIGGSLADDILDKPGLYVTCTVETLDDSGEAAGWVVCHREIELPHVGYRCPCCGIDVIGTQPICSDCELAGCRRSQRGGNDRGWYDCQRDDTDEE
jgi:hypothetical protein